MVKQIKFTVSVEPEIKDRTKIQAVKESTTITKIVRKALLEYLEKVEK